MATTSAANGKSRGSRAASAKAVPAVKVSDGTIKRLSEVFRLLADEHRLKILLALAHGGELHVSALCELLKQSQPAVSHHLSLMRARDLVGYRRDGKHNYYYVQSGLIRDLLEQFFADAGNGHKQLQFEEFVLAYRRR
ncbi:MAG TPA: metalloregulator ArsR/SmtB family transcription factor [Gemmataceae bacterium]|nr:metalloregulator ArsR/SmtB family transcription factor [Gemmataceae bacterium]